MRRGRRTSRRCPARAGGSVRVVGGTTEVLGEDQPELHRRWHLDLVVATLGGCLVGPPAHEACRVPEPAGDQLFGEEARTAGIARFLRTPGLNSRPTFLRALADLIEGTS